MNQTVNHQNSTYSQYSKAVFVYLLFVIGIRFFGDKFLIDFHGQPIKEIGDSYFFWLTLATGLPHFIINHYAACILVDITTVLLPFLYLFSKKYKKWWLSLFVIFFWVQTATVEIFSCSHSKSVVCLFLAVTPIFFSGKRFLLMVDFVRYAGAFFLVSAAYFKYANGALVKKGNYSIVLVNQYYDRAIMNPEHFLYQIASFIIDRPWLGDMLFKALFLSQAIFIVTFFTRKFDRILIISLFSFSVLTYVFMGIYNLDILIMAVPLYFSVQVKNQLSQQEN